MRNQTINRETYNMIAALLVLLENINVYWGNYLFAILTHLQCGRLHHHNQATVSLLFQFVGLDTIEGKGS